MQPKSVRRTSFSIALVGAGACLLYAWVVTADASPAVASGPAVELSIAAGAREFELRCARCHTPAEAAEFLRARSDSAAAALELCAYLLEHAQLDDARSRAIVLFLARETTRR